VICIAVLDDPVDRLVPSLFWGLVEVGAHAGFESVGTATGRRALRASHRSTSRRTKFSRLKAL
jgi:hypothetical protein